MADELMPCPFCGGEVRIIAKPYEPKVCVGCDDDTCLGFSGLGWLYDSEQEAAEAWNRRAERTCNVESSHEVEGDGCYAYFEYELSCGHEIAWGDQLPPSYCPECGRRVLYDSDDYI